MTGQQHTATDTDPRAGRAPAEPQPLPPAVLVTAAARAFSAGNGYLTGQIVDRCA